MASSITFLALPLDFFFFFFLLLLPSEDAPPRILAPINARDEGSFRNVDDVVLIVDVLVGLMPVANFETDEQRITKDKSVLIVQDCVVLVCFSRKRIVTQINYPKDKADNREVALAWAVVYLWKKVLLIQKKGNEKIVAV